jgi:hypothetical protein
MNQLTIFLAGCVLALGCIIPLRADAQVVFTEVQPLTFGTMIMTSFATPVQVVVHPQNILPNYSGPVIPTVMGSRGHYNMTGAPPNTPFTITYYNIIHAAYGGNPQLTLDNFTFEPAVLVTNGGGVADFFIGARMTSVGGGSPYGDGPYLGNYSFDINF